MERWPESVEELGEVQRRLGTVPREPWTPPDGRVLVAACFVCFARGTSDEGLAGEPAWAAATLLYGHKLLHQSVRQGRAGAPYVPGHLAMREGPLLEEVVRSLERLPDVLIVNASGRDHPRCAGLALHLGAVLDVPTVGVTHRPLYARGEWPTDRAGDAAPLTLDGDVVGYWLRTRRGARPVAVHAAWRTSPEVAVEVVARATHRARTPEPLRRARRAARLARAGLLPT